MHTGQSTSYHIHEQSIGSMSVARHNVNERQKVQTDKRFFFFVFIHQTSRISRTERGDEAFVVWAEFGGGEGGAVVCAEGGGGEGGGWETGETAGLLFVGDIE